MRCSSREACANSRDPTTARSPRPSRLWLHMTYNRLRPHPLVGLKPSDVRNLILRLHNIRGQATLISEISLDLSSSSMHNYRASGEAL